MVESRDDVRARLREKLKTKRSVRNGQGSSASPLANAEGIALDLAGGDAQTLGIAMEMLKNPKGAKDSLRRHIATTTRLDEEDDDEAPPPVA